VNLSARKKCVCPSIQYIGKWESVKSETFYCLRNGMTRYKWQMYDRWKVIRINGRVWFWRLWFSCTVCVASLLNLQLGDKCHGTATHMYSCKAWSRKNALEALLSNHQVKTGSLEMTMVDLLEFCCRKNMYAF